MYSSNLILLVEPEQHEVSLFERAVRTHGIKNPFRVLPNTDEVKKYIRGIGIYKNRELFPLPALILLNLDGPTEVTKDFLFWLRNISPAREIVLIGLSHFDHKRQNQELLDLGMNGFFVKRHDVSETLQLIEDVELLEEIIVLERQRIRRRRKSS